jgi:hypothetical protein
MDGRMMTNQQIQDAINAINAIEGIELLLASITQQLYDIRKQLTEEKSKNENE